MTVDPGTTLGVIRERKPLVHNITNYVVMNETANAILALGALMTTSAGSSPPMPVPCLSVTACWKRLRLARYRTGCSSTSFPHTLRKPAPKVDEYCWAVIPTEDQAFSTR